MKISKEARKVSRDLFRNSFKDGKLDASTVGLHATRISATKPRKYIEILKNYQRLIRLEVAKNHAVIESATPLDEDVSHKVLADLRSRHGEHLTSEFKVIPELIGGIRIRLGSNVWDSSVSGRLNVLQSQMALV